MDNTPSRNAIAKLIYALTLECSIALVVTAFTSILLPVLGRELAIVLLAVAWAVPVGTLAVAIAVNKVR